MNRKPLSGFLGLLVFAAAAFGQAPAGNLGGPFRKPAEAVSALKDLAAGFPAVAALEIIGKSAGGREIPVLRLAGGNPAVKTAPGLRPAVLITAGLDGGHVAGTEAALRLAGKLVDGYVKKDGKITALLDARTVYVAPLLNPDGAEAYFGAVRSGRFVNARPVDEDADGAVDEDGFEDLDKNGAITQMRMKDPEGVFIPDPKEPRLLRPADPAKGEKGIYKVFPEGIDNDGDGEYNEDPPGGVQLNRNYPHDFEYFVKTAGLYPASEPETAALLQFMTDHPQIGLVLAFGLENTILNQKQTGQAKAGSDKVKPIRPIAELIGLDPEKEYTLKEIAEAATTSGIGGGMTITEEMVAGFLGVGPAMEIDKADLPFLEAVQKDYKEVLKAAGKEGLEKHARGAGKGSFGGYVYFQYGVPFFSTDLWQVPEPKKEEPADKLTAEKLKAMTAAQFLALGEEKIAVFLKDSGAPPQFNSRAVMEMVESGKLTTIRMAEMMAQMPPRPGAGAEEHPDAYKLQWADAVWGGRGFTNWTPFKHPQLGDVEIGGFCPHFGLNPPADEADAAIGVHVDFYLKMMDNLPVLEISGIKAEPLGGGVYGLTAYVSNTGRWPTSTAQGRRARTAWPIRVTLVLDKSQTLFSGRPAEEIPFLDGGETKKVEWTIRAKPGSRVAVKAWSPRLGAVEKTAVVS